MSIFETGAGKARDELRIMTSRHERPVAVILAGGKGRRIGGRKAFVSLGGRPLVAHVIDRMAPQVSHLAINAAPDPAFESFGLPILPDPMADHGPLAGVLAAMDWAHSIGDARVVTVAVDTPFLPEDVVARLASADARAAHAVTADGPHATTAIWSVGLRGDLRGALQHGVRKVRDWTASIGAMEVPFDSADAFLNINTAKDLRLAEERLAK
jgi:molybdopterin-guanine dinucleotide biosynthesis protein A